MYSKIYSAALAGMESFLVEVETDVSDGLPHVEMVGALSTETKEARERVRTALKNSGIRIPPKRITISLAPADRRKDGTGFDLAMAAGILLALRLAPEKRLADSLVVGELSLDGSVRGVRGVLAIAWLARKEGLRRLYDPRENETEGAALEGIQVIAVDSIGHLAAILRGEDSGAPGPPPQRNEVSAPALDFSQIGGQIVLRRAAEAACAGMHNLLMVGPAGTGKSMVAKRIPGILPPLSKEERIEISMIYSIGGYLAGGGGLIDRRPFRSPHHTISGAGLAGGGRIPRPGEISLAHGGVLFLDELPEFRRDVLETLRQPMEDRKLTIVRAGAAYEFPADFMLVAAMNPCRCGFYPDRSLCRCTQKEVDAYLERISRPLLDRIDICTEVEKTSYTDLKKSGEPSAQIRRRVEAARAIQKERFAGSGIRCNARIPAARLAEFCPMESGAEKLLMAVYEQKTVSIRGLHSLQRVARTLADLEGRDVIGYEHVCEAVFYRRPQEHIWKGENV